MILNLKKSSLIALSIAFLTPLCGEEATKIYYGDAPSGILPGEVVVKTEKDVEQGKQNVISVANQLRELFKPVKRNQRSKKSTEDVYLKVIPAGNGKSNLVYKVRHSTSKKLVTAIEPLLSNDGNMDYAEEQNLFLINDNTDTINALAEALPLIDMPSPQVLIEAKVVEVSLSDGMQRNLSLAFNQNTTTNGYDSSGAATKTGVTNTAGFGTTSLSPTSTSDGGAFNWVFSNGDSNISASFQWLLTAEDAKVLSSPTILVARNEKSVISNGQDVPIQSQTNTSGSIQTSTTFKRIGVTLTVTPLMLNSDSVTLKVEPSVSNIQSYDTVDQGDSSYQVPVVSIRSISTYVKLADGQVVIMGGLYNNRESILQERIPFLSDIPYFGEFFTSKYTDKELLQLMFFLRVRILSPDDIADGILFDPDEVAESSDKIGEIIRNSKSLPKPETTLEKVKHEFIERNPDLSTDE